jgi:hypothetical protein
MIWEKSIAKSKKEELPNAFNLDVLFMKELVTVFSFNFRANLFKYCFESQILSPGKYNTIPLQI